MADHDPRVLYNQAADRTGPVLHIRFQGKSRDIALEILTVETGSADDVIKAAVANFLDIGIEELKGTVIERHENGNLTLRPEAVFG